MKIILDLDKTTLSPLELMYLFTVQKGLDSAIDMPAMEGYAPGGIALSIRGRAEVRKAIKVVVDVDDDELNELTDKYREHFKGLAPGIMGSRDNLKAKLKEFKEKHEQYSNEHILKAIQRYIMSVNDFRYLQRADYTVEKNGDSRLLAFCEDLDITGVDNSDSYTELI